ncbi:hypothetical protein SODALDRAFT_333534 [Sodiomyces alkalinus F11]|uniref:Uncharacterized protein n=1 Tax=Sodiomyces alkalinus (strain CBS 110278 / VKM F-3762 / F11) TaxID=1314773 RepID=A0A3N2PTG8_SODAK|nr:hypothetical protein SODALDRAFT_333534 [Sodiomyces alkalinus F11]ROT37781.1 hypothetical protein SODALDRAFT_333534 [Sodiomyces alkalinus F11]
MPLLGSGEKTTDPENTTPTSESKPEHRPHAWTLKTTLNEVLETVRAHLGEDGPKPKFDDVCPYDISETQENMLWEHETTRLMGAVDACGMRTGLRFESYGKFQQDDSKSSYERLASLADQIMLNLHICILDNELLLWKSKEKLSHKNARQMSKEILQSRLDNPKSAHKTAREDSEDVSEESFLESYFAMVDYLTAVVARFGVSAAEEGAWQRRVLAGLAKSSAKLKILARKPDTYVTRSIDAIRRYETEQRVKGVFDNSKTRLPEQGPTHLGHMQDVGDGGWEFDGMPMMNAAPLQHMHREGEPSQYAKELEVMVEVQDDSEDPYLSDMADAFSWVSSTLRSLVYYLMAGSPLDSFEISTVTYRGGTTDTPFPVYMHQDRNSELHGSSDPDFIKHAYLGYVLAKQAVEEVQKEHEQNASVNYRPKLKQDENGSGTVITFQIRERCEDPNNDTVVDLSPVNLTNLAQIITVMIPVLLTSPEIISVLRSSLSSLGGLLSIDVEEQLTPRSPSFTAVVSIHTRTFQKNSPSSLPGAEFRSLSQSLLAHSDRQVSHSRIPTGTAAWSSIPADEVQQRLHEVQERRARLAADGQDWDIDEMAVRVKCVSYVYSVLGIAGFLVAGGLAAAFTIGDRVEGVDPFNIASFSWLLAGFLILIAKSIRVTEWPWRDFLLGRVTCRSLSELRAVTSANEQDLILYLLTKEPESVLITRGPYNRLFTRKEEQAFAGGFSIDIKPEVRTLVAAGLIFVVVALRHGTALVCLDLRRGSEKRDTRTSIAHTGEEQTTVCRYPPKPSDKEKVQDAVLNHLPMDQPVVWNRVLGFYHSPERKVR